MEMHKSNLPIPSQKGPESPTPVPIILVDAAVATILSFAASVIGYHYGLHEGISLALGLFLGLLFLLALEARRRTFGHGN